MEATARSPSGFVNLIDSVNPRKVLLILDCCQGAGFSETVPEWFFQLPSDGFRLSLAASRADEPAWEHPDLKSTPFTRSLLRVIKGIDQISREPGLSYREELIQYIRTQLLQELDTGFQGMPSQ